MDSNAAGWRALNLRVALIWLAMSALLLAVNAGNVANWRFPGPDDTLRLVQVRDLLAGQPWFDLHQYRIDPGASPLMHWSRLVDIPLAGLIFVLTPLLGGPLAEHVTITLLPLVILAGSLLIIGRMAFRLFDTEVAGFACLTFGFSPLLIVQFAPMRIDHHGWQIFAVVIAVAALLRSQPVKGGVLAGAALAVGLSISMEVLPYAAAIGVVLGLRWLRDGEARWLAAFMIALALSLVALFAATRGAVDLSPHCDVISPAHLGLFLIVASVIGAGAASGRIKGLWVVPLLICAGGAGLAFYIIQAPQCTAGPFGNLDPLVRQYWYLNIAEGRPIWHQPIDQGLAAVIQGLIALGAVVAIWLQSDRIGRNWWTDYGLVLLAAFATGLAVSRSMAFVGALSAVPIGWLVARLLTRLRSAVRPAAQIGLGLALIIALMPAAPFALGKAVLPRQEQGTTAQLRDSSCDLRQSAQTLNALRPSILFTLIDMGPAILERTPHSVIATAHHRGERGLHDVIEAFLSSDDEARQIVMKHESDYLLICTDIGESALYAKEAPDGLMAHLLAGDTPAWLEEVPLDTPDSFRVWRVKD